MEHLLEKIIDTAPGLVVMFFFVKMFLTAMAKRDDAFLATVNQINRENLEAREKSRAVIRENAIQVAKCTLAMSETANALRTFAQSLKLASQSEQRPTESG